jgi:hypothetical protein
MGCWRLSEIKEKKINEVLIMAFSTKEKLALREAIHAMKWLDKHHDGWGLEEECAILENICSNCGENEIKSNHNYLDLQYQLDSAEAEVSKLQSEIKKNKEELSDYWQVHDEQVTIIKTQTYEIKRLQNEIDIIKKRSEHNDLQDAASARQQMDIIKRLREEIKILKLGDNNEQCTNLDHDCVFQNLNESDAIAIAGAHGKDHYLVEQKVAFCIRNFKGCCWHKCWQITEGVDGNRR